MDVESLKNKVFFFLVSISTLHLLSIFINLKNIPNDKIIMYMGYSFALLLLPC